MNFRVQNQLRKNADAEMIFHHGLNGMIIFRGETDSRIDVPVRENRVNIIIHALGGDDERLSVKGFDRERFPVSDRVVRRQDSDERVLIERNPGQAAADMPVAEQTEIRFRVQNPFCNIIRSALTEFNFNLRVFFPEAVNDFLKPAA